MSDRRGWWRWMAGWLGIFAASALSVFAQTDPGPVDLSDREAARVWFNTWWPKTYGAPMGFTGDAATGNPGDTSQAYKDQVLLRVNIFRRMMGAQPVTFDVEKSRKAQAAAMLMSANGQLSHEPPTTWKFWSQDAADGAKASHLALGLTGPSAILGFLQDFGPQNEAVGHRLFMLWPPYRIMGTGNVPAAGALRDTAALWKSDPERVFTLDPQYKDRFVRWPPIGYVPNFLITGRWNLDSTDGYVSASGPDFTAAEIEVTRDGVSLPVKALRSPIGLTFTLDGTSEGDTGFVLRDVNGETVRAAANSAADVKYTVRIRGILDYLSREPFNRDGVVQGLLEYQVIAYDPAVAIIDSGRAANLINISTRSFAGSGSSTQIAGIILRGTSERRVLIRGGGPWLKRFNVENALENPTLTLFEGQTVVAVNDDWGEDSDLISAVAAQVGASPFDAGSRDAALVANLKPGIPYTVHVSGKNGSSGNGIVEVYDADSSGSSKLINISTRSHVGTGASIQIAGFVLRGLGPRQVLIRAGGPWLGSLGVENALPDPRLQVFQGQTSIAENDNWGFQDEQVLEACRKVAITPYPAGSKDSAIVLTVSPNIPYTAQVSGVGGVTGNALIEVYEIP